MDHKEIAKRKLVSLYVTRRLSAVDAARFEEHFVDCPVCLNQIEQAEPASAGLPAARPVLVWLAAAAVLVAMGIAMWQATNAGRRQAELEASRADAQRWKQRYEIATAKGSPNRAPEQPLVASTFVLNITRSAGDNTAPANRIPVAPAAPWIALSLDRDWEPGFTGLRATLTKAEGDAVWQKDDLTALPGAALTIALPSSLLGPGDYLLSVEGKITTGEFRSAGRYRFRAYRP